MVILLPLLRDYQETKNYLTYLLFIFHEKFLGNWKGKGRDFEIFKSLNNLPFPFFLFPKYFIISPFLAIYNPNLLKSLLNIA